MGPTPKEKEKNIKAKQTNIVRNSNNRIERKLENREVFKFFSLFVSFSDL